MQRQRVLCGAVLICALLMLPAVLTADETVSIVELENTDACSVVQVFDTPCTAVPAPEAYLQTFAERMFTDCCHRIGYDRPMKYADACGAMYAGGEGETIADLPEDVTIRPLMMECRNAVEVEGPADGVAVVEEQIRQLDTPDHDLVIELRWVDWPDEEVEKLGAEWTTVEACPDVGIDHPAHPLQFAADPAGAAVGMMEDARSAWRPKCAEFYLDDGVQSILAMGEVSRWCCPFMRSDSWTRQPHEYRKLACFFFGVEMWVLPTIEDGAVRMRLRPRTGEAATDLKRGIRTGLRQDVCTPWTLVQHQAQEFTATVGDGESLLIRGLARDDFPIKAQIHGPNRPEYIDNRLSREPTLIITPMVLAD